MRPGSKRSICLSMSIVLLLGLAFLVISGSLSAFTSHSMERIAPRVIKIVRPHIASICSYPHAKRYLTLPEGRYYSLFLGNLSFSTMTQILINSLFNSFFQPLFICVFTPQVIMNYILFPFFLFGIFKYFKKVPLLIITCFAMYLYLGMRDTIVESLIRHRMSCEQIYLLVGVAGFINWITRSSSS